MIVTTEAMRSSHVHVGDSGCPNISQHRRPLSRTDLKGEICLMSEIESGACMPDHEKPKRFPLTSSQKELWLSQFASVFDFHEVATRACFPLSRRIEPEILQQSIEIALQHTPLLTATLVEEDGEPFFEDSTVNNCTLHFWDVSGSDAPEIAAKKFMDDFFELSVDHCLAHFALVRVAHDRSIYALKTSHIALDGLGNFFHVALVADIYQALQHGQRYPVNDGACQLEQYLHDKKYLQSERSVKDIAFWEHHLARIPEKRIFRALPGRTDILGDTRVNKFYLSRTASETLERLGKRFAVSTAVSFSALYALIIGFMSDERQITIQTPIAFGERRSFKRRQGAQLTLPPLFVDLNEHETFASLTKEIAAQNTHFFRHIQTPYQMGMRRIEGRRFEYLADMVLNFLPQLPTGNPAFPVITAEQHHSPDEPALFGTLILKEPETGLFSLTVRSSRNHLTEQDVKRYVQRLELLSIQLERGLDLGQLDFLLADEKAELARWQHGPAVTYPHRSIPDLFDEIAQAFADAPAVHDEHGACLSYAELRERAVRCASWLAGQGVKPGDIVAVSAERTLNLPEIILGIMRCGAVYLPLDPTSPPERLDHILRDAHAKLTLTPSSHEYLAARSDGIFSDVPPENGAYLIYTSGSTGRPKGVLAPHCGFVNMIRGQIDTFGVTAGDRVLLFASPAFDASLSEMFMALLAGACLYPVGDSLRHDPWALKRYMADHRVSVVTFPPSYLRLFDGEPFPELRILITAGEPPVAADVLHYAGQLAYFNAYGPTETCVCASIKKVGRDASLPVSVGQPIQNVTARILNSKGCPLPAGMVGELWIGGASVSLGYHQRPELTKRQFRLLPGIDEQVNYATGDLARWTENGEIMLVGRADDQVKIRGNRVELGEVSFLLEQCPGVRQALVLVQKSGSGQFVLVAFLVSNKGFPLDTAVDWARNNLPTYMIPSAWHVLEAMPVTVTGKIDRNSLCRLAQTSNTPPCTTRSLDGRLAALCEQALGKTCVPERSFFEQGGNSLSGMAFLYAVRKEFSVDIPFRELMQCESLFDIEHLVVPKKPVIPSSIRSAPLSHNQFKLWAYQQANAGAIDYNMPLLLEVRGERAELFLDAFLRAVRDQELLATTISGEIDTPVFMTGNGDAIALHMTELADVEAANTFFDTQIHRPFDLRHEPPVRLTGGRLDDGFQLLVLLHHLVGDAETLHILLRNAVHYLDNQIPPPGMLATQAAYCDREHAYLRSDDYRLDAAYWHRLLAHPPAPLHAACKRKGAMARIPLAPEYVHALELLAHKSGASLVAALATLVSRFLCKRFRRREILVGLPVGMRETHDEFHCAGFYVNAVPLRLEGGGASDMASSMREAVGQLKLAVQHGRFNDFAAVADVMVTHAVAETMQAEGVCVRPLEPVLRASKLSACFVLETGEKNSLILEYNTLCIPDGESLLHDFRDFAVDACDGGIVWDKAQLLADAWEKILLTRPDETSDFLFAGGDSIKAIQIVGRLHRTGVSGLKAADFLRSTRFSDLVALLVEADKNSEGGIVLPPLEFGQQIPLLPLQDNLIRNHAEHWRTFLMLLPMTVGADVEEGDIRAWLKELPERFEALRLAFNDEGAWYLATPQRIPLQKYGFNRSVSRKEIIRSVLRDIATGLTPEAGRTLGAGLVEHNGMRLVILVGHHLVLDMVSFDLLRQDLTSFLQTGSGLKEGHGVATWAVELGKLLKAGVFPTSSERQFWEAVCRTPAVPLLVEQPGQPDKAVERELQWESLADFRLTHTNTVQADLLSALSAALYAGGQRETVFIALESHGRDSLRKGFEIERSVGWFTALCPLPLKPLPSPNTARQELLPWINKHCHPRNGIAYGVLKQQEPDRYSCACRIGFNYFGKASSAPGELVVPLPAEAMPGDIPELIASDFNPEIPLELTVFFDDADVLHLGAYFSPKVLPASWVNALLQDWATSLKQFPAYQEPLPESLMARIREVCLCTKDEIETVQAPGKTHALMLLQQETAVERVFTQQIEFLFRGEIDEHLLAKAWGEVVGRHETLRSLFACPYPGEYYRVTLKRPRMQVELHDLSWLPEHMASPRLEELLETGRNGAFQLETGPLLRAQFFRLSKDRFVVSWCSHHLLMDGWCIGLMLDQLFSAYSALDSGAPVSLPEPMPLAVYDVWRSRFDEAAARTYWNSLLAGFASKTVVCNNTLRPGKGDPESVVLTLPQETTRKLQAIALAKSITLFNLLQPLWAVLLSTRNNGCRDVVFGIVLSGRPPELAGIEHTIGLFTQTVPVRIRWDKMSLFDDLLIEVREQTLNQMQYGYLPLSEIGRDLLDHTLVYENYPMEGIFGGADRQLLSVNGYEKTLDPLSVAIVPGDCLSFDFLYDPDRMSRDEVQRLLDDFQMLMEAVPANGSVACVELETLVKGGNAGKRNAYGHCSFGNPGRGCCPDSLLIS